MTKLVKNIKNNQKGFTLIELMIVVAIIGILAAIAIPNFLQFQLKSKTAEAKSNLGAIRTAEEAFFAERDRYKAETAWRPSDTPTKTKQAWGDTPDGFDSIGFAPTGPVYYVYSIECTDPTADFTVTARGNLDGDDTSVDFTIDQDGTLTLPPNGF